MMSGAWVLKPALLAQYVRLALGLEPMLVVSVKWERRGVHRQMVAIDRIKDWRLQQ